MTDKEVIALIVKKSEIPETKLKKIPVLKNCDNWKKVLPLGLVDHLTNLTAYRGALVEYAGKLYFVRKETMAVLHHDINWKVPRLVKVI